MNTSRRRVVLALGSSMLVPMVAAPAWSQTRSRADRAFEALSRRWLDRSMRYSPISATTIGDHRYDTRIDDVSAAGRDAALRFTRETLNALEAIDASQLSRANQVDALILGNSLRAQIWQTESLQSWAWNPLGYQSLAGGALYGLMAREFAPLPPRLQAATVRMEQLPALLAQARAELQPARVPAPHAATYAAQNPGLKSIVTDMIEPHKDVLNQRWRTRLETAIQRFNAAVDEHQTWITETLVPAAQADFRVGAQVFDQQLGLHAAIVALARRNSPPRRCRRDQRARGNVSRLQARARWPPARRQRLTRRRPSNNKPRSAQRLIWPPLNVPRARSRGGDATEGVEEARRFVMEHDLITLPEGPVRVI
jgi:hypothetical protein